MFVLQWIDAWRTGQRFRQTIEQLRHSQHVATFTLRAGLHEDRYVRGRVYKRRGNELCLRHTIRDGRTFHRNILVSDIIRIEFEERARR